MIIKISMQTSYLATRLTWKSAHNCYQFFFYLRQTSNANDEANGPEISFGHIFTFREFAYREARSHLVYIPFYILPTICHYKQTTNRISIQCITSTMEGHRAHCRTCERIRCVKELLHNTHTHAQHPPFDLVI